MKDPQLRGMAYRTRAVRDRSARASKRAEKHAARAELDRELERLALEPPRGACDGDCAWCLRAWRAHPPVDVRGLLGLTSAPVTARLPL